MLLEKVYKTFVNLDTNYARSKKDRATYLSEKFGGDIEMGSFLIMQALSRENISSQEDIEKLSFIRGVFDYLVKNKNRVNSLNSFLPVHDNGSSHIVTALRNGYTEGTRIAPVEQSHLISRYGAYHMFSRMHDLQYVPMAMLEKVCAITPVMANSIMAVTQQPVKPNSVYIINDVNDYILDKSAKVNR